MKQWLIETGIGNDFEEFSMIVGREFAPAGRLVPRPATRLGFLGGGKEERPKQRLNTRRVSEALVSATVSAFETTYSVNKTV